MKFGGKIHNGDTKIKFDFGSDRVKVKVKRGQNNRHTLYNALKSRVLVATSRGIVVTYMDS